MSLMNHMSQGVEDGYVSTGPALKLPVQVGRAGSDGAKMAIRGLSGLFGSERGEILRIVLPGPGPTRAKVWPAGREGSGGVCPAELGAGYWKLML